MNEQGCHVASEGQEKQEPGHLTNGEMRPPKRRKTLSFRTLFSIGPYMCTFNAKIAAADRSAGSFPVVGGPFVWRSRISLIILPVGIFSEGLLGHLEIDEIKDIERVFCRVRPVDCVCVSMRMIVPFL